MICNLLRDEEDPDIPGDLMEGLEDYLPPLHLLIMLPNKKAVFGFLGGKIPSLVALISSML
jgi:hypothetical protein